MFLDWKNQYCQSTIFTVKLLSKATYGFSAIRIKLPMVFLMELETNFTIFIERHKTPNNQSNLDKEEQS